MVYINWSFDELLLYIGLVIIGFSLVSMIAYLIVSKFKLMKLNNVLDDEYGKEKNTK